MGALDTLPRDWVTGETVTAAMFNAEVRDKMSDLRTRLTDSGWQTVTVNSGFASSGGNPIQVRKIGTQVFGRWGWANTGITANSTLQIGTIPAGYRPSSSVYFNFRTADFTIARGIITTAGVVQIDTTSTVASYFMFPGTLVWFTD